MTSLSPFGQQLRLWRNRRGLSQMALAHLAETTPRHVSFIETGRSRPGEDLVLRLADSMDLELRDRNTLLRSAGLSPIYPERELDDAEMGPVRQAIETLLERHAPYPATALDIYGQVLRANATAEKLFPGAAGLSAEQMLDGFLSPGPGRDSVQNFAEVAWTMADRLQHDASRTQLPRLRELAARAATHLADVPRPAVATDAPVLEVHMRVGDQVIRALTSVLRFDSARDITASELRIELLFPVDAEAEAFFRGL